ncbi:MAG: ABC transporter permease, partial [Cyclobacteriaceae bacterium]|nr:ABC transporter permease [Cyclobacteriaceae bacterium]
ILVGLIVTLVSLLFVSVQLHNIGIIVLTVLLTSMAFALGGLINAVYAKTFDDISIIPTFVLTPLTYLGGVFYSLQLLPGFWQQVAALNPVVYMVNAFRFGFLGISDVSLWLAFGLLLALIVLLFSYAMYLINKGIGLRS